MPRNRLLFTPSAVGPVLESAVAKLSDSHFWNEMKSLESQFLQQFHDLAGSISPSDSPLNVTRHGDQWKIDWEVPGASHEDFEIHVNADEIALSVHRSLPEVVEGERLRYAEISSSHKKRSYRFPFEIDREQVKATYQHGVLTVQVSPAPQSQPQKIEVTAN